MASQSVPMVTASTAAAADDGDEVFMEQEAEGWAAVTSQAWAEVD